MDQTKAPIPLNFVIDVDAIGKVPATVVWADATHLTLTYVEAALGPAHVHLLYSLMQPNYRSVQLHPVFTFDLHLDPI